MKNLLKKHKKLAIATVIALILLLVILAFFIMLMLGGSSNKYGNRLEGIEEVKISGDELDTVTLEIEEKGGVSDVSVRVQGKIINVIITYNSDIGAGSAKELAEETLDSFSEEVIGFYNIQYFLTREYDGEEDTPYVITGNKHPSLENIGWVNGE